MVSLVRILLTQLLSIYGIYGSNINETLALVFFTMIIGSFLIKKVRLFILKFMSEVYKTVRMKFSCKLYAEAEITFTKY